MKNYSGAKTYYYKSSFGDGGEFTKYYKLIEYNGDSTLYVWCPPYHFKNYFHTHYRQGEWVLEEYDCNIDRFLQWGVEISESEIILEFL